jgi:hypothetical protein
VIRVLDEQNRLLAKVERLTNHLYMLGMVIAQPMSLVAKGTKNAVAFTVRASQLSGAKETGPGGAGARHAKDQARQSTMHRMSSWEIVSITIFLTGRVPVPIAIGAGSHRHLWSDHSGDSQW